MDAGKAFKQFLDQIVDRVSGLFAIIVSDRDGVVLTTALGSQSSDESEHDQQTMLDSTRLLASSYATACDQSHKTGLNKNNTMIAFYDNRLIVHINALPLVVTLAAESDANAGLLMQLAPDVITVLEPLRVQIQQLESQMGGN